jgi:predicted AAA+ superfamily ATPase
LIHSLIEERKNISFIFTGSSARKLKRSGTDLLAGRSLLKTFHPFIANEIPDTFNLTKACHIGMLPLVAAAENPEVEGYITVLEDLLLCHLLPVFSKKAKRKLVTHRKFYYFDAGVFYSLRPKGPLDRPEETAGPAWKALYFSI